jgi:CRP-like cAMP-binding protein
MNKIEIIRRIDIFSPLSDIDKALIAAEARPIPLTEGQVLCRDGDEGRTFWVVGMGSLAVLKGNPPLEVARLKAGDYVGEMSLLTGAPRTATVQALEFSELLELDRPVFMRLFSKNEALAEKLSSQVAARRVRLERITDQARRAEVQAAEAQAAAEAEKDILGRMKKIFGF